MLYPLKFDPVYKEIIWGGRKIGKYFNRIIPDGNIAESWELSCRDDGMSIISNGELKGTDLLSLFSKYKERVLGTKIYQKYGLHFPLLIKIIDANDKLSVQVHPDDAYARLIGQKNGKNEMWYIIDARENAKLIYGLKDNITKEVFLDAVKKNNIGDTLNEIHVKAGDCLYIPSGTVHAILDGILIAEIQQNSNTTFRIYDWDRRDNQGMGRELHLNKALDTINFNTSAILKNDFNLTCNNNVQIKELLDCEYFNVDEITIDGDYYSSTLSDSFACILNICGSGIIYWDNGEETINPGDSILLPSCLGAFKIKGSLKLLYTCAK